MSNYEYSTYTSSSTAGVAAGNGDASSSGFDISKAIFNQADTNADGIIDRGEFQNWISGAGQQTSGIANSNTTYGTLGGVYTIDTNTGLNAGSSTFESSSVNIDGGANSTGSNIQTSSTFESANITANYDASVANQAATYTSETNASWSQYGVDVKGSGLYFDANPQIIRRPATGGVQTYTQNIKIRFLQPPPIPPPGPIIIKEVRPPQPPPPPPLRIRQKAQVLPQQPPLVLRERPPPMPAVQASQTIVRQLPAIPVPPRSVIIERIPPAPPRPRDIIIERWLPYAATAKRKTVIQRAEAAKEYPKPRNIIVQYEPVPVRVVRQFQRLGVVQESPQAYVQRYGTQLLDAQSLLQQARAAGIVEDISAPAATISSSSFVQGSTTNLATTDITGVNTGDIGGSASYSSSTFENATTGGVAIDVNNVVYQSGLAEGNAASGIYSTSSYESSASYSGVGGINASSGFNVNEYSTGVSSGGFDLAASVFSNVDKNKDGKIDAQEFQEFYRSGL